MKPLILASTSPYRHNLLDNLGLSYTAASPQFDESDSGKMSPRETAEAFARGKAQSLRREYPDSLIIGSDQVPALGDLILRKPTTQEAAIDQLMLLSGKTHQLITAVALLDSTTGRIYEDTVIHDMEMRSLTRDQATHYVKKDNPVGCAGAYKIEANGHALFRGMQGSDHTAIIGLPISVLGNLLIDAGDDWLRRCTNPN